MKGQIDAHKADLEIRMRRGKFRKPSITQANHSAVTAAYIAAAIIMTAPASAEWKPSYALASPEVQDWYRNAELTPEAQKRFHFIKCCAKSEAVRTKFTVDRVNGHDVWSYLLPTGQWKRIPEDIIHPNGPTPENLPVLFVIGDGRETCFFPGDSGI